MKAVAIGSGLLLAYLVARLANFVFGLAGAVVYFVFDLVAGLVRVAVVFVIMAGLLWAAMHQAEVIRIASSWIHNW